MNGVNRLPTHQEDLSEDENDSFDEMQHSIDAPICLEGTLYCRRGRSCGHASLLWKKRFVFLSLKDGGSITVYKEVPRESPMTALHTVYSKLQHRILHDHSSHDTTRSTTVMHEEASTISIHIPSSLPWVVKDLENSTSKFAVEIPVDGDAPKSSLTVASSLGADDLSDDGMDVTVDQTTDEDEPLQGRTTAEAVDELMSDLKRAKTCGKPWRLYFKCHKGNNEKALWLQAFSRLNRLSAEYRMRKTLLSSLTASLSMGQKARVRRQTNVARDVRQLELVNGDIDTDSVDLHYYANDVEELARGSRVTTKIERDQEFRVQPAYSYPHRWMTRQEMREDMVLPSETFHDLRVPGCQEKEIGSLRVEVLQCLGLPKLDRTSLTDAIVYLVCGSYAFATDVIPNRANPMWLRKARRACDFPLFHGYARLYVGVFDDDRKRVKDEFAGRVVLDLARLRPGSSYDVTLPLRLSTHVYSRRSRGAIRLRFTLRWKTERDALLSYIPKRVHIPLPQNSRPKTDVTVMCADQKAFRNIAITVHGAHLPGKFTFQQMRAAIREINFTRKYIFTSLRTWQRNLRHWQFPTMSAFVFCAWMHCVYANAFSLVPAYVVLFFLLQLMSNYVVYGIDGPGQRGFIPLSWEELFTALVCGGDPDYRAIEPLDLMMRPLPLIRRKTPESLAEAAEEFDIAQYDYKVVTHQPKGKALFRALGFLGSNENQFMSADDRHLEFPFANGFDYPKFTVKESLVNKKRETVKESLENRSADSLDSLQVASSGNGEIRMIPRFSLEMEMPDIMRKDASGLRDYDDEEENFNARLAVMATGKQAVSTLQKTATGLTDITGLHHVVNPISHGIGAGVASGKKAAASISKTAYDFGEKSGFNHVVEPITHGMNQMMGPVSTRFLGASQRSESGRKWISSPSTSTLQPPSSLAVCPIDPADPDMFELERLGSSFDEGLIVGDDEGGVEVDPAKVWPEQNVDVEGPSNGKKLTDDLADIKDKMHEVTWHLFDDKVYIVKNPNAFFFGQSKKGEKKRKKTEEKDEARRVAEVSKDLDKLLKVGQYSHPNPFVARVGLYVEPIIGSAYSFLCLFRAGFNVMTWRDPMLTFWLSFFSGLAVIILFVFPWRIFLFFLGVALVGPQNWAMRILRERGYMKPLPPPGSRKKTLTDFEESLPDGQPLFTLSHREPGGKLPSLTESTKQVDTREVHRVVVPYSPLVYHRFYDWPPEPQYAQVKRDNYDEARHKLSELSRFGGRPRMHRFNTVDAKMNRRRGAGDNRRRTNSNGVPDGAPRSRRANTGDWQPGFKTE